MIFPKWGGGGQGLVGFQHRGVHFGVVDLLLLLFKISTDVYLMWYIQISATSLVFSSLLSLPSTVPSPTNSHVLYEVRYVEGINKFHVNHHQQTTTSSLKKISCDVMHLNVSNLPGLLLQVLLAVHGVVDHQLSCTWCLVRQIESINSLINHHNHSISHLS